jgi:hypothetical protein
MCARRALSTGGSLVAGASAPPASAQRKTRSGKSTEKTCRVAGCCVVLDPNKNRAYNIRYRLCHAHLRADKVLFGGRPMRFCQKCSRFEDVSLFNGTLRTCQMMLNRHRKRRHKKRRKTGEATPRVPAGGNEDTFLQLAWNCHAAGSTATVADAVAAAHDLGLLDKPYGAMLDF